ncbi:hypothetical protein ACFLUA_03155 [Chloroflexota bacterium]
MLVPTQELLLGAGGAGYAIGALNIYNMEGSQAFKHQRRVQVAALSSLEKVLSIR